MLCTTVCKKSNVIYFIIMFERLKKYYMENYFLEGDDKTFAIFSDVQYA